MSSRDLNLRHLRTFLVAAEELSFTRAAGRVHLSQPAVTEQIRALEQALEQPLFVRANNRLALTPAGQVLVSRARELLALAEQSLQAVRDGTPEHAATVNAAAPAALCAGLLAPLVGAFATRHPLVRVCVHEKHSRAAAQAVAAGEVDFGLVHGWPEASELRVEVVARDHPVVLLPAGHALAESASVSVDALASAPLVLTGAGCRYRAFLDCLLQTAAVRPTVRAEADGVPSLLRMVGAGLGATVLPSRAAAPALSDPAVAARPLACGGTGLPICLLRKPGTPASPQVEDFLGLLRAAASDQAVPALDVQHGAGGVAVGDQEDDRLGDVLGRADAANRELLRHRRQ